MKQGLTDLERGKYLPDGDEQYSVVRVAQTLDTGGGDGQSLDPAYRVKYFENAGARDQNVNGSVTPVNFVYTFAQNAYVQRIDIVAITLNFITFIDYGSIQGPLTNGVQILTKIGATETELINARRWINWAHLVNSNLNVNVVDNSEEYTLVGSIHFNPLWKFSAGDQLITRIRDDLSILRYHRTSLIYLEV